MEITIAIIIVTSIASIFCINDQRYFDLLKFNAYDVRHGNQWYRFFSYGFLHAGWLHLFVNMIVLFSFGKILEATLRSVFHEKYILYYILLYMGGLLLSIIPAYGKHKNDVYYNSVGASGAISSVVFAMILLFPQSVIHLFMIPFGIPSPVFGVLYLAYEFYMSRKAKDNIGHDAHFWGAVYGIIFMIILSPPHLLENFMSFLRGIF